MRHSPAQRPLHGISQTVGADRTPGLSEGEVHVFFGVVGINGGDGAAFFDEQVEEDVEAVGRRILAAGAERDHAVHRLTFVLRAAADQHSRQIAADSREVVVPAGDAAADVFFLADLNSIFERFGNRGYRAVQLEAGILGGKMYLAAYAQRLGATGLTFYDDDVTDFFSPHAKGKSAIFLMAFGTARARITSRS